MSWQSAGGKATAIKSRKKAIERYYENPNICLYCNNIIHIKENQKVPDVRIKKFCNHTCAAKFNNKKFIKRIKKEKIKKSKPIQFEFLFNTSIKDIFKRYKAWQNARSTIQKHARCTFQKSDKQKSCVVCGYLNHYEVCHIIAVKDFDKNKTLIELNHIDNLVALCPNHHWEFDNGKLKI